MVARVFWVPSLFYNLLFCFLLFYRSTVETELFRYQDIKVGQIVEVGNRASARNINGFAGKVTQNNKCAYGQMLPVGFRVQLQICRNTVRT